MQPGDRVQLKSGGPMMTVQGTDILGVACVWFNDRQECCQGHFDPKMLIPIRIQTVTEDGETYEQELDD